MNREQIAHQVSTTLGDFASDFDLDAILDDLVDANIKESIDELDTDAYWDIVRRHDQAARVMEEAAKAHASFVQAEADYKAALSLRQFVFARTVATIGRGGNARLARELELSAPTVKSIADRGRAMDRFSPEYAAQFPYMRPTCIEGICDHANGCCERMRSEDCRHGECDHATLRLHCAELPSNPGVPADGWELD